LNAHQPGDVARTLHPDFYLRPIQLFSHRKPSTTLLERVTTFPVSKRDLLMRKHIIALLLMVAGPFVLADQPAFRLAPLFTDNMVLQQQTSAAVWGYGTPGADVTIHPSWGKEVLVQVKPDGSWMGQIKTPRSGGPFQIRIRHQDSTAVLHNVLVGEVWLCSGQSNMEMPLEGWPPSDTILHAQQEIANASYPGIRLFSVQRAYSPAPESSCEGSWEECTPQTAAKFSATAFFFGKSLRAAVKCPIGLINTSWGGTRVEAWTSADYLMHIPECTTEAQKVIQCRDSIGLLLRWLKKYPVVSMKNRQGVTRWAGLVFDDDSCASPRYDDRNWPEMNLPILWEKTAMGEFDGAVWFRKAVHIPAPWVHRNLQIELGPIDDYDITFVNGRVVGSHEMDGAWKVDRVYKIPGSLVSDTLLNIAVRVVDSQGGGGVYGNPAKLRLLPEGETVGISLAGNWRYLPVAEYRFGWFHVFGTRADGHSTRPRLPIDLSANTYSALFNGMIAPLAPFAVRGAIWYQGEANTGNPTAYKTLFPLMIENWRASFHQAGMPFYFVQIAPWDYGSQTHSEFLREAQLHSLSVPNTGMAVTLDIGNPRNIHPANKADVGNRLALWAKAKVYRKSVSYSGPVYRSMKLKKQSLVLSFDYAGRGLVIRPGVSGAGFEIAGEDSVFRQAVVKVQGSQLIVSHPEIRRPLAARYAFSNTPEGTLFNKEGLPASSFRTDSWQK
jgi:sialate O-acetylesterase